MEPNYLRQHQRWPSSGSSHARDQLNNDYQSSPDTLVSSNTQQQQQQQQNYVSSAGPSQQYQPGYMSEPSLSPQSLGIFQSSDPAQQIGTYPRPSQYYDLSQTTADLVTIDSQFPPNYYQPDPLLDNGEPHYQNAPAVQPTFKFTDAPTTHSFNNPSQTGGLAQRFTSTSFQRTPAFGANFGPKQAGPAPRRTPSGNMQQAPPDSQLHAKRPKTEVDDDDDDNERDENKSKPLGACARCKTLKVKCEFKTDNDPCRRCLNGGHDCIIPGRKKRRTPPKREHLLNQIREQADQIAKLMAELEKAQAHSTPSAASSPANYLGPSDYSPTLHTRHPQRPGENDTEFSVDRKRAVEDWLSQAKDSLAQFGGLIALQQADGPDNDELEEGDYGDEYISNDDNTELTLPDAGKLSRQPSQEFRSHSPSGKPATKPADIPSEASAWGLMGHLSLSIRGGESDPIKVENEDVGVANDNFFRMRPLADALSIQSPVGENGQLVGNNILTMGVVTPVQVDRLFSIFFDHMNASVSLLDPALYTAQDTYRRSPFLFTVICAIASRYDTESPGLYQRAMHYAQMEAGNSLTTGRKSIEMCAAYMLLALYPVPSRRWDENRTWLYLGVALRLATDLNLHQPSNLKPTNEAHAREMLNRTRVWLNCFNLDRSTGSLHGKLPIIPNTDYLACHSEEWWKSSPYNMDHFDIHLCAYNNELRVMSEFFQKIYSNPNHPKGVNKDLDLEKMAMEADDTLVNLKDKWFRLVGLSKNPQDVFRTSLLSLAYSYARLVALSHGFQYFSAKNKSDENPFLKRCLRAASDVVSSYTTNVAIPSHYTYIRHGAEAQSTFVTFASAFLIKLLKPKFTPCFTKQERCEIRVMVLSVIERLSLPEINVDENSAPKLYARFLEGLLQTPVARVESQSPVPQPPRDLSAAQAHAQAPNYYSSFSDADPSSNMQSQQPVPNGSYNQWNQTYPTSSPPISPDHRTSSYNFGQVGQGHMTSMPPSSNNFNPNFNNSHDSAFETPFSFDQEMVWQMHNMTDANMMQDITALPGLAWMSNFSDNQQANSCNSYNNMNHNMNFNAMPLATSYVSS